METNSSVCVCVCVCVCVGWCANSCCTCVSHQSYYTHCCLWSLVVYSGKYNYQWPVPIGSVPVPVHTSAAVYQCVHYLGMVYTCMYNSNITLPCRSLYIHVCDTLFINFLHVRFLLYCKLLLYNGVNILSYGYWN